MEDYKLLGRMEDVTWDPHILTFKIERHGGTVMGSSRAEFQRWKVDVNKMTVGYEISGHRQIHPMVKRLDVRPIAEEIVQLILDKKEDERLKWKQDRVTINIGKIKELEAGSALPQTLAGRRKRFRTVVDELLVEKAGWIKTSPNNYRVIYSNLINP